MKIILAVIAGTMLGLALKNNKPIHIHTQHTMSDLELAARLARMVRDGVRKGVYFH